MEHAGFTVTNGRAPIGTQPGSLVHAMNKEVRAKRAAGRYSNKKIAVENKQPEIKWQVITPRANM